MKMGLALVRSLTLLGLLAGVTPASLADASTAEPTAEQRGEVIAALVQSLRTRYVLAEKGARVADVIEKLAAAGHFASATEPDALATALTAALWEASHDKHLRVSQVGSDSVRRIIRGGPPPAGSAGQGEGAGQGAGQPRRIVRGPAGFAGGEPAFSAAMLPGRVGLLTVHRLMPPVDALAAAFRELAGAEALIVDVRNCPGGGMGMPAEVAGYLFDEPQVLLYMESRDGRREPVQTARRPEGAPSFDGKPSYVTTSSSTGSACEELAFDLKYHEKALLVGEATAGAGLGSRTGLADLGHGFEAFVPDMKPVHPRFEGGFEGVGVPPDVTVSAADALAVAHMSALSDLIDRTAEEPDKRALEAALTASARSWVRDARDRAAGARAHRDLAGSYEQQREIRVEGGRLYYIDGSRGIRGELLAQGQDTFAMQGSPGQLLRFERDAAGRVIGLRISEPGGQPWRALVSRL